MGHCIPAQIKYNFLILNCANCVILLKCYTGGLIMGYLCSLELRPEDKLPAAANNAVT